MCIIFQLTKQREISTSKLDEKADKLMKKATKNATRRTQTQEVEMRYFRLVRTEYKYL